MITDQMIPGVIYLRNRAFIYKPDTSIINHLAKNYVYDNPKYNPFTQNSKEPQFYRSYDVILNGPIVVFDIGILVNRDQFFNEFKIIDERVAPPFKFDVKLPEIREYQTKLINAMVKNGTGSYKSPCGSGKSLISIKAASLIGGGLKTLIIVDEIKLLSQWTETLHKMSNVRHVGKIGNGSMDIANITVATVQTLDRLSDQDWKRIEKFWGILIFDECHKVPSKTALNVVNRLWCKFKIGVSATPTRTDFMEILLYNAISKIKYEITDKDLKLAGKYVDFKVVRAYTGVRVDSKNFNEILDIITHNESRNNLIIANVKKHINETVHLILTSRIEHAKLLVQMLKKEKIKVGLLIGEIKSYEREKIRHDKSIRVLVGSSVADKGLDHPAIGCISITCAGSSLQLLEQRVGRGRRVFEGKDKCIVYDYIDKGNVVQGMFNKRLKYYEKSGSEII